MIDANQLAAQKGGKIAGDARKTLEQETGKKISVRSNYLSLERQKNNQVFDGKQTQDT